MKFFVSLFIVFVSFEMIASPTDRSNWFHTFELGKEEAQNQNSPIMVEVYATWCGYCRRMRKEIYQTEQFEKQSRRFTLISIDGEKQPAFANRYQVSGYPTVLFLDKNGVTISRINGFIDSVSFYKYLDEAFENRQLFEKLQQSVNQNPKSYLANYKMADYFKRAQLFTKSRESLWRAYYSNDLTSQVERQNLLFEISVLSMRVKDESAAIITLDRYIEDQYSKTTDFAYAKYYRAIAVIRSDQKIRESRRNQINDDLHYASQNLPFPKEREKAEKLIQELSIHGVAE